MADDHRFVFPAPDRRRLAIPDAPEVAQGGSGNLPR